MQGLDAVMSLWAVSSIHMELQSSVSESASGIMYPGDGCRDSLSKMELLLHAYTADHLRRFH